MNRHHREQFDTLLEAVISDLPTSVRAIIDEVPVVVLDVPTPDLLVGLELEEGEAETLCGLHTGIAATERSIEHQWRLPSQIHLFRVGIIDLAGGFDQPNGHEKVREQIRITLLHEIGHEFGLDEDDLEDLGYD